MEHACSHRRCRHRMDHRSGQQQRIPGADSCQQLHGQQRLVELPHGDAAGRGSPGRPIAPQTHSRRHPDPRSVGRAVELGHAVEQPRRRHRLRRAVPPRQQRELGITIACRNRTDGDDHRVEQRQFLSGSGSSLQLRGYWHLVDRGLIHPQGTCRAGRAQRAHSHRACLSDCGVMERSYQHRHIGRIRLRRAIPPRQQRRLELALPPRLGHVLDNQRSVRQHVLSGQSARLQLRRLRHLVDRVLSHPHWQHQRPTHRHAVGQPRPHQRELRHRCHNRHTQPHR